MADPLVTQLGDVGQNSTYNDAVRKYDAQHGKYANPVDSVPEQERWQESQMPEGPNPSPFKVGPMTPGGR